MAEVDEPFSFVEWVDKDGKPTQYFYQLMLGLWRKTGGSDILLFSARNIDNTAVGNVGTGTDNLISYTMPADTLNINGYFVRITAWGTTSK